MKRRTFLQSAAAAITTVAVGPTLLPAPEILSMGTVLTPSVPLRHMMAGKGEVVAWKVWHGDIPGLKIKAITADEWYKA